MTLEIWDREWHHEPPLDGLKFNLTVAVDGFKTGAIDCQTESRLFCRDFSDATRRPWYAPIAAEYSFAINGVLVPGPKCYQAIKKVSELAIRCSGGTFRLKNPRIKVTPHIQLDRRLERHGKRAFDLVLVDFEFIVNKGETFTM